MAEYPLFIDGEQAGRLTARRDGLRLRLEALCPRRDGLWRAAACTELGCLQIGVMMPEGSNMRACKVFNLSSLPIDPEGITHGSASQNGQFQPSGWTRAVDPCSLFADAVLRKSVKKTSEIWIKHGASGLLAAMPYEPGKEFPVPAVFALCRVQVMAGRSFVVFSCGEKGTPCA